MKKHRHLLQAASGKFGKKISDFLRTKFSKKASKKCFRTASLIIESMKMEIRVDSAHSGRVVEIRVKKVILSRRMSLLPTLSGGHRNLQTRG
jgi:pyruvate carboxylase